MDEVLLGHDLLSVSSEAARAMPAVTRLLLFTSNLDVNGFQWQLGKKVCRRVSKMLLMADLPRLSCSHATLISNRNRLSIGAVAPCCERSCLGLSGW